MVSLEVRRVIVLSILVLGILMLFTGLILYTSPKGYKGARVLVLGIRRSTLADIHAYIGFILVGLTILHIYTNYKALLCYLGIRYVKTKRSSH